MVLILGSVPFFLKTLFTVVGLTNNVCERLRSTSKRGTIGLYDFFTTSYYVSGLAHVKKVGEVVRTNNAFEVMCRVMMDDGG